MSPLTLAALLLSTSLSAFAETLPPPPQPPLPAPAVPAMNVVFVTLDGIRWQEFLGNKPDAALSATDTSAVFPHFWSALAPKGVVYGDGGNGMTIANFAVLSLPGYMSMFAGAMQPCFSNQCTRITVETFPERLVNELKLPASDVATFTTWDKIALAVEHAAGTTSIVIDSNTSSGVHDADRRLWPKAISYLQSNKPRFLYISLGDADDYGHDNNYPMYLQTMREYDDDLAQLFTTLAGMGDYGKRTTVIVTTDHGRGKGPKWKDHGGNFDGAPIWLFASGPTIKGAGRVSGGQHNHLDIRPTVEALLGLCPVSGPGYGQAFAEAVPAPVVQSLCPPAVPVTAKATAP